MLGGTVQAVMREVDADVAVLKIDAHARALTPLELGNSDSVRVGDTVYAIGNPFGYTRTLTSGIVSAVQRQITAPNSLSIDNVIPDEVSKKSLKVLDRKLQVLAEHADFHVNINSVVGSGVSHPQDALTIGKRALELGFSSTIGIIHDGTGQVQPLNDEERRVYHEMKSLEKRSFTRVNAFQDNIALGRPNQWRCRAGGRYLYICEDGLVHYCSQQRGYPGIPLEKYTLADLRREFHTEKSCAPHCTVSCVHQVSVLDAWRAPQWPAPTSGAASGLVQIE